MKFWNLHHYNCRVAGCREPIWPEQLLHCVHWFFARGEFHQYWYVWKQYIFISSSVQGQNWSINLPALSLCEAPAAASPCVQPLVKYLEIYLIGKTQKKKLFLPNLARADQESLEAGVSKNQREWRLPQRQPLGAMWPQWGDPSCGKKAIEKTSIIIAHVKTCQHLAT